jgi:hypothetical protein
VDVLDPLFLMSGAFVLAFDFPAIKAAARCGHLLSRVWGDRGIHVHGSLTHVGSCSTYSLMCLTSFEATAWLETCPCSFFNNNVWGREGGGG